jgi:phosphoglycerate dehydrogenase-like enzyme
MAKFDDSLVAVTSRSFSTNQFLVKKLKESYPNVLLNLTGKTLKENELVKFLANADKAIVGIEIIDKDILDQLPKLKLISKYGVGLNNLDLDECKKRNIQIKFQPGSNKQSVAEFTLLLMLNSLRQVHNNKTEIIEGNWTQAKGQELKGKKIGIIGFGNIGSCLVSLLKPFGNKILFFDERKFSSAEIDKFDDKNLKQASISEVLSTSDIVSIHIPLSSGTKNMINKNAFKQMRESIILINTSRGGIVDEVELYKFLKNNNLAFASFDVFEHEPAFKSPLLKLDNFFASSHRASLTEQGIESMGIAAINGLGD